MRITQARVRSLIVYNPSTGSLIWRFRERKWFPTTRAWRTWNRKHAGQPAFATVNKEGYLGGLLFNRSYVAHRIAFMYMVGHWPTPQTDHLNGDRADNRWCNLRECSAQENARNMAMSSRNTTGHVGIYRYRNQQFCASIKIAGQARWLGHFQTKLQAVRARRQAEKRFGFSPRHGRPPIHEAQSRPEAGSGQVEALQLPQYCVSLGHFATG